jgi:hypothetical protein
MRLLIVILCLWSFSASAQNRANDSVVNQSATLARSLNEWRRMAEEGQAIAQYNLGLIHEYGRGVAQNDVEAVEWYRKASVQGMSAAQYKLGIMYDNGWGVAPSNVDALKWYGDAAEQGHPFAQHDLAFMYAAGTGVPQDYVRAYMWLDIAVASGNSLMAKHLNRVSRKLSVAQIEEAHRMTREWMEKNR